MVERVGALPRLTCQLRPRRKMKLVFDYTIIKSGQSILTKARLTTTSCLQQRSQMSRASYIVTSSIACRDSCTIDTTNLRIPHNRARKNKKTPIQSNPEHHNPKPPSSHLNPHSTPAHTSSIIPPTLNAQSPQTMPKQPMNQLFLSAYSPPPQPHNLLARVQRTTK